MKRTRLKPKRLKPRPHVNTVLRHDYLSANPWDEIIHLFPNDGREAFIPMSGKIIYLSLRFTPSEHPHHIAGGANGAERWDLVTNLAALNSVTHRWVELYRPEGFVLCAKMKMQKGEWDEKAMRETVLGLNRPGASVVGYLGIRNMQFDWVQKILDEMNVAS